MLFPCCGFSYPVCFRGKSAFFFFVLWCLLLHLCFVLFVVVFMLFILGMCLVISVTTCWCVFVCFFSSVFCSVAAVMPAMVLVNVFIVSMCSLLFAVFDCVVCLCVCVCVC